MASVRCTTLERMVPTAVEMEKVDTEGRPLLDETKMEKWMRPQVDARFGPLMAKGDGVSYQANPSF